MLTLIFFLIMQQTLSLRIETIELWLRTLYGLKEELRYVCVRSYNDVFKYLKSQSCQSHTLKQNWTRKIRLKNDWDL